MATIIEEAMSEPMVTMQTPDARNPQVVQRRPAAVEKPLVDLSPQKSSVAATPFWHTPVFRWAAGTSLLMLAASGITGVVMHHFLLPPGHGHGHPGNFGAHSPLGSRHAGMSSFEDIPIEQESLEDALAKLETEDAPKKKGSSEADKKKARSILNGFIEKKKGSSEETGSRGRDGKESEIEEALNKLEGKKSSSKAADEEEPKTSIFGETMMEKFGLPKNKKGQKAKRKSEDEDTLDKDKDPMAVMEEMLGRKKDAKKEEKQDKKDEKDQEKQDESNSHLDFAKLLKQEKERKPEYLLKDVKDEFTKEHAGDAKSLMCTGCKLIAARFGQELNDHDVHEQDSPHLMLGAKRRAIDAACKSFRHLDVVQGHSGLKFEAVEAAAEEEKRRIGQRLCMAVLEDARFDLLMKMIQSKVPSQAHMGANAKTNWERYLCAQHAKICKNSEVRDDDEL